MSKQTKKKLVPKLRFPEFQDAGEWVIKPLCEIGDILQGYGFPEKYQGKTQGKYPFYKVSDISNAILNGSHFIEKAVNYIDKDDLALLRAKTIPVGTTVFAKIGEAIRSNRRALTTAECLIDNNVAGVKAIRGKANDLYIFYVLSQINLIEYSGGAVPSVNKTTLENIPVFSTEPKEQQKIADCLSSVDELITTQAQKVDALKAHKKGLMQQLFPAEGEGETDPKLRFPEFRGAGEWEEKQLERFATFAKGKGISKSDISLNGVLPCIRYGELYTHYNETIDTVISYTNVSSDELVLSKANDVIIPASGETQEDIATASCVLKSGIALGGDLNIIRTKMNGVFLSYYLNNAKNKDIAQLAQGISVVHLYSSQLKKLNINIPELPEQKKIADCLSSVDVLITAQTQKLDALKAHKKGLMQQLFPAIDEVGA
ncbi:MAG: restriction endonuclease subunit S [Methyloprofundus sp.]|nr:restriction endonuclease subunit S [Methyloprofundus sp.]